MKLLLFFRREKARTKYHLQRGGGPDQANAGDKIANLEGSVTKARGQTSQGLSREARSQQRPGQPENRGRASRRARPSTETPRPPRPNQNTSTAELTFCVLLVRGK